MNRALIIIAVMIAGPAYAEMAVSNTASYQIEYFIKNGELPDLDRDEPHKVTRIERPQGIVINAEHGWTVQERMALKQAMATIPPKVIMAANAYMQKEKRK